MTPGKRLDTLEAAYYRRQADQFKPRSYTTDAFIRAAIRWLEMSPEAQRGSMPEYTEADIAQVKAKLLGPLRRALMR